MCGNSKPSANAVDPNQSCALSLNRPQTIVMGFVSRGLFMICSRLDVCSKAIKDGITMAVTLLELVTFDSSRNSGHENEIHTECPSS
jgi:hypothetical protein